LTIFVNTLKKYVKKIWCCLNNKGYKFITCETGGCVDYELFGRWTAEGVYFVIRLKGNASYEVKKRLPLPEDRNILKDQIIMFKGFYAKEHCPYLPSL
jgi:hypothetical protein